jgi:hypothetical protein
MAARNYIRVRTIDLRSSMDMVRYVGYRDVAETLEPTRIPLGYDKKLTLMHRFSDETYTYFMQPRLFNSHWLQSAVERWQSFGVKAEIIRL